MRLLVSWTTTSVWIIVSLSSVVTAQELFPDRGPDKFLRPTTNNNDDRLNEYIVVFRDDNDNDHNSEPFLPIPHHIMMMMDQAKLSVELHGGSVFQEYRLGLSGFAATLTPAALADLHTSHPQVDFIEPNDTVSIDTATPPPWGLDRLDGGYNNDDYGLDGSFTVAETGQGVQAYVVDTGIHPTHDEFVGRLGNGFSVYSNKNNDNDDKDFWADCHGHGTHVASTLGGTQYGVAKSVTLHAVRVLNCQGSGYKSDVIRGLEWIMQQHYGNKKNNQKSVANLSLGGAFSKAQNKVVDQMVKAGIAVAVAAGNSNQDACQYSPSSASGPVTVASTNSKDKRSYFSNYGSCVDLFAPGSGIMGAWHNDCKEKGGCVCDDGPDSCFRILSGTSMASPHVAGVMALWMERGYDRPADIHAALLSSAVHNLVQDTKKQTPNVLIQVPPSPKEDAPEPKDPAPIPKESYCQGQADKCKDNKKCSFDKKNCCCSGLQCVDKKCVVHSSNKNEKPKCKGVGSKCKDDKKKKCPFDKNCCCTGLSCMDKKCVASSS